MYIAEARWQVISWPAGGLAWVRTLPLAAALLDDSQGLQISMCDMCRPFTNEFCVIRHER